MEWSMTELLKDMVSKGASDLHLRPGNFPGFRIDGKLKPQESYGRITPEITDHLVHQILEEAQLARFREEKDLDFSYAIKDCARFRVNVLTQRGSTGVVVRTIPDKIPSAADLSLPEICLDLALKPRGLVLVTGATGSGKSTTLAAMVDHVNRNVEGHILTMEDPIEFIHPDQKCFVTQRQVGRDTKSFAEALRRALRQDPDVILIGEMRDLETIALAISAAETGHLVFGTLHTTSAISTVDRILDVFPPEQQAQVRVQLSGTLQGVISQCLVRKIGGGRVAAHEILVATDAARAQIREGKTAQMLSLLQTGSQKGMCTLESKLIELVNQGLISLEDALGKSNRPLEVEKHARPGSTPAPQAAPAARPAPKPAARPAPQAAASPAPAPAAAEASPARPSVAAPGSPSTEAPARPRFRPSAQPGETSDRPTRAAGSAAASRQDLDDLFAGMTSKKPQG